MPGFLKNVFAGSLAITHFPGSIRFDRTPDGRFRVEVPDISAGPIETATWEELLDLLKEGVPPATACPSR